MSLSTLSIKRPVFTIVINLTIILFGVIGYSYLGVREFPSIDPAQISVRTNYTGANADSSAGLAQIICNIIIP